MALLAFAGACAGALILRGWILAAPGAPPGVDGGNWLAFGDALFNEAARASSVAYPPAVPILLSAAVDWLGPTLGVATVASLSALAPAIGVFFLLRWAGLGWRGAMLASLLIPASAFSEAAAWGGYPQLLAVPFVLWSLWLLHRWLRGGEWKALLGAAVAGALVAAISHFGALIFCLAAVAISACHLSVIAGARTAVIFRRVAAGAALTGVLALPLAPIYARLIGAAIASRGAEPSLATIGLSELPGRFADIHGAVWPIWALGAAAAMGAVVLRGLHGHPLWIVNAGFTAALVGAFLITRDPRVLHELPTMAVLGLALWVHRLRSDGGLGARITKGAVMTAALVSSLAIVTFVGIRDFPDQRDRYAVLDPDLVQAMQWIRDETPAGSLVAVSSVGDAPLGWWVEGLARRPALYSAPLRWLTFPEERVHASEANRLFLVLGMPSTKGMRAAEALGVDYVLLAKTPPAYDPSRVLAYLGGAAPVFENDSALILRVERFGPIQPMGS